jgi:hypothetical protein
MSPTRSGAGIADNDRYDESRLAKPRVGGLRRFVPADRDRSYSNASLTNGGGGGGGDEDDDAVAKRALEYLAMQRKYQVLVHLVEEE